MSSGTDMSREERQENERQHELKRNLQRTVALTKLRTSGNAWSLWLLNRPTPPTQAEWTLHQDLHAALKVLDL